MIRVGPSPRRPLLDQWIGDVRSALIALFAGAGCVLLIGATTLANLFLVQCFAREREIAVRTTLGATRARLTRELLVEATMLSIAASAIGVGVAVAGVRVLRALAPASLPRVSEAAVDGRMLGFCALATVLTVLVFGALPAWKTSRAALADFLRRRTWNQRGTAAPFAGWTGHFSTDHCVRIADRSRAFNKEFHSLRGYRPWVSPGGRADRLPNRISGEYPTANRETAFAMQVVEKLATQPGVTAASVSTGWPGRGVGLYPFTVVGDPSPDEDRSSLARATFVSPDYFRTMGITLRRGREILPTNDQRAMPIVVIDDDFAQRIFAGRDRSAGGYA